MTSLVAIKGPIPGQRFALHGDSALIGRQEDAAIYLESLAVSRHHARVGASASTGGAKDGTVAVPGSTPQKSITFEGG